MNPLKAGNELTGPKPHTHQTDSEAQSPGAVLLQAAQGMPGQEPKLHTPLLGLPCGLAEPGLS